MANKWVYMFSEGDMSMRLQLLQSFPYIFLLPRRKCEGYMGIVFTFKNKGILYNRPFYGILSGP